MLPYLPQLKIAVWLIIVLGVGFAAAAIFDTVMKWGKK